MHAQIKIKRNAKMYKTNLNRYDLFMVCINFRVLTINTNTFFHIFFCHYHFVSISFISWFSLVENRFQYSIKFCSTITTTKSVNVVQTKRLTISSRPQELFPKKNSEQIFEFIYLFLFCFYSQSGTKAITTKAQHAHTVPFHRRRAVVMHFIKMDLFGWIKPHAVESFCRVKRKK